MSDSYKIYNHDKAYFVTFQDKISLHCIKLKMAEVYYIYTDYLCSPYCLTDATGTVTEEHSFDPWGRQRNPTDWTYNHIPASNIIDRGFTGHEHLPEFALINMNGRMYDPVLGTFISPDNYVQLPDFTQGLNRYSYALNNPLVYTDPTGDNPLAMLSWIAGAYLVGGYGTAIAKTGYWTPWGENKWSANNNEGWKAFHTGGAVAASITTTLIGLGGGFSHNISPWEATKGGLGRLPGLGFGSRGGQPGKLYWDGFNMQPFAHIGKGLNKIPMGRYVTQAANLAFNPNTPWNFNIPWGALNWNIADFSLRGITLGAANWNLWSFNWLSGTSMSGFNLPISFNWGYSPRLPGGFSWISGGMLPMGWSWFGLPRFGPRFGVAGMGGGLLANFLNIQRINPLFRNMTRFNMSNGQPGDILQIRARQWQAINPINRNPLWRWWFGIP